jgi:hypothetical protein
MKKQADIGDALHTVRAAIAKVAEEISHVQSARLPLDEALPRIAPLVDQLAARWRSNVADLAHPGPTSVDILFGEAAQSDAWSLAGMVAAVHREAVIGTLETRLRAAYADVDPASCIPMAARAVRITDLRAQKLVLEQSEERLVLEAERAGLQVDRRGDADPAAVFTTFLEDEAAA